MSPFAASQPGLSALSAISGYSALRPSDLAFTTGLFGAAHRFRPKTNRHWTHVFTTARPCRVPVHHLPSICLIRRGKILTSPRMVDMQPVPRATRKRRRPTHSCLECHRRKVRCDRNKPCGQCVSHKAPSCDYASDHRLASDELGPIATGRVFHTPSASSASTAPRNVSPTSASAPSASMPIRGSQSKTRVFGHGHWMSFKAAGKQPKPLHR